MLKRKAEHTYIVPSETQAINTTCFCIINIVDAEIAE